MWEDNRKLAVVIFKFVSVGAGSVQTETTMKSSEKTLLLLFVLFALQVLRAEVDVQVEFLAY